MTAMTPARRPARRNREGRNTPFIAYLLACISFLIVISVVFLTIPYLFKGEFICDRTNTLRSMQCIVASWWGFVYLDDTAPINATVAFWSLFAFRYFRLFISTISYFFYKPSPVPAEPTCTPRDVTVLVPTVDSNDVFLRCVRSIATNNPTQVFVITVGQEMHDEIDAALQPLRTEFPTVNIEVHHTEGANKRWQINSVIPLIRTRLTSMADASVIWGTRFLSSALAPLEDPNICLVGTNKRVQRTRGAGLRASFWNFIGCLYLERHNFELRASNAMSGEVFVISGRTNIIRTSVIQNDDFRASYTNERFFLNGMFGPLAADDDNFIVRWVLKRGWGIKFQYQDDARIEIAPIGEYPRFLSQCLRWSRTTWRSNPAALKIAYVWFRQPYSVYSIYLSSFFNFALFFDALLVYLFCHTSTVSAAGGDWIKPVGTLVLWIICSKMVKLVTYFWREPLDLVFFPGYVAFAYFHSFIKLWALVTFWDVA